MPPIMQRRNLVRGLPLKRHRIEASLKADSIDFTATSLEPLMLLAEACESPLLSAFSMPLPNPYRPGMRADEALAVRQLLLVASS